MDVALKVGDEWEACRSTQVPSVIDDTLKHIRWEALSSAYQNMGPEEVFKLLPMVVPETSRLVINGLKMKGYRERAVQTCSWFSCTWAFLKDTSEVSETHRSQAAHSNL